MPSRVVFDDDDDNIIIGDKQTGVEDTTLTATTQKGSVDPSLCSSRPPQSSLHWEHLKHETGDVLLKDRNELLKAFQDDLQKCKTDDDDNNNKTIVPTWSCILGYCEALATNKDPLKRYSIFPVPISALRRLVEEEFVSLVTSAVEALEKTSVTTMEQAQDRHRKNVQAISTAIWAKTQPKANVRDEIHANSVYVCLRGKSIDKKSLDCFGAALATIAGLKCCLSEQPLMLRDSTGKFEYHSQSFLTLSEDHAYERHQITQVDNVNDSSSAPTSIIEGTCEVAVPGTSKDAKSKRGRDIATALNGSSNNGKSSNSNKRLTPETSWLYMAKNPYVCDTIGMTLVAVVGNLNPTIDMMPPSGNRPTVASGQLYDLKRDLLWVLYDEGYMNKFSWGLLELGDCEEHRASSRGNEMVSLSSLGFLKEYDADTASLPSLSSIEILKNEELFLRSMHINLTVYDEAHVYPYFCAGHYHKDAGKDPKGSSNEYRLVEAMALYARAAFVASKYPYHIGCLQLNKHMTTAAMLIAQDMMTVVDGESGKRVARKWHHLENEIAFGTWLLGFFDSLLYWEENSGESTLFVEILGRSHNHSLGKLFSLLETDVRGKVLQKVAESGTNDDPEGSDRRNIHALIKCMEHGYLSHYGPVRSKRLSSTGLLWNALGKPKISINEMVLVIPTTGNGENGAEGRSSRRTKRPKTS